MFFNLTKNVVIVLMMFVISILLFKYERSFLYQGDLELTYSYDLDKKICLHSKCGSGMKLDILNSGNKNYRNITIFIRDVPLSLDLMSSSRIRKHMAEAAKNKGSYGAEFKKILGGYDILINDIPPGWMVELSLSNDDSHFSKSLLENVSISFSANGSIMNENPYKVAALLDVVSLISIHSTFKGISKYTQLTFSS